MDESGLEQREQEELLEALKRATLGEYDIYSPLGRGGMASVFLALELSLNRPVAIKVISPSALSSTTVIERFWLEARTAASLSHPNVIPIYTVKSNSGLHYFVMKHIQGGSLDIVLKNEGPFSFGLVRTILTQVSSALAYAHRRGIVHRDIKPGNIMLDDDGYAVVMDFGIAKVRDVAALTASGAMVGTPFYMSPEQFGGGAIDGRSDQYSLGVVAFELLTGKRPFKGDSIAEVLRGHLIDKAPDVRTVRLDCPTGLATLINRMLSKSATDRFPSMDAVCTQLESMPRMDADKMREKIAAFARTASLSSPQINQPVSPTPLSRTSSVSLEKPATEDSPLRAPTSRLLATIRHHPFVTAAIFIVIATVSGASLLINQKSLPVTGPKKLSASESTRSSPVAPVPSPLTPEAKASTADTMPIKSADKSRGVEKTKTLPEPVSRKNQRAPQKQSQVIAPPAAVASSLTVPAPAAAAEQPPAEPPVQKSPPVFLIGTRASEAVLYIDGQTIGFMNSRMRWFKHEPGRVHIQIKADDCMTYDTSFVIKEGDSTLIGWRGPDCRR
jgi:serine/threonine protein kinase